MGLKKRLAFLGEHKRIAIDANIFAYLLERSERTPLAEEIFGWIRQPGHSAVASTIVLPELLFHFYKDEGTLGDFLSGKVSAIDIGSYRASGEAKAPGLLILLGTYPNLEWIAADFDIADLAAKYRARYLLKTPDALHAATAVRAGATAFLTNDLHFNRVVEFEALQFDKLV